MQLPMHWKENLSLELSMLMIEAKEETKFLSGQKVLLGMRQLIESLTSTQSYQTSYKTALISVSQLVLVSVFSLHK